MNISVAMAAYNGEPFIQDQLESIAAQTLQPYELVVTDDGSEDRTREIVERFADNAGFPVRLLSNQSRLGFANNFLRAASLCRGDLIAFCDQDDIWMSDKLARCHACFKDDEVMLSVHSGRVVDEDLRPLGWSFPGVDSDAVLEPLQGDTWKHYSGFALVFRSSLPLLLKERPLGSVKQAAEMFHDQWVCFLANVFGKTAYIREPLVLYRRHEVTATNPGHPSIAEDARQSLSAGEEAYIERAQLAEHWASYLERNVANLPDRQKGCASDGARHYRRVAHVLYERSRIYRYNTHLLDRIRAFIRLVMRGSYRTGSLSGLCPRSAVKDLIVGVFRAVPTRGGGVENEL